MPQIKYPSKKEIREDIAKWYKDGEPFKINKTTLSIPWMDAYVVKFHPEKKEEWANFCASIPPVPKKQKSKDEKGEEIFIIMKDNEDNEITIPQIKTIRDKFITDFFPDFTDEAIEARKKAKKEAKAKKEQEKEARKKMPLNERILDKLGNIPVEDDEE